MENEKIILTPDPARVMEGLRDTGYDFNTALADLVDNSIAAFATVVKVKIDMDPDGEVRLYIADNGCGMNMEGLKNAMRYGSARRADASSLGKFGLGLKTASTAFCRCLSVLSKDNECDYHKVQWDLDEVCQRNEWELLTPEIDDDEIDILEDVSDGGQGTLVIWEKVDRLMKNYKYDSSRRNAFDKIVDKLRQHFGMVYQRFLDKSFEGQHIDLYVNEELVEPWDPFCRDEANTKILAEENVKVELDNGKSSSFKVTAYLLPRVDQFSSSIAKAKAKISNDLEGFYVYRENRLIHCGDWLGMFVNDPHISLLRVSFSFDHTLDDAFNVDIKKSRILLNEGIFDYILKNFIPAPRREAQDLYRTGRTKAVQQEGQGAHQQSNNNIEDKAKKVEESKVEIIDAAANKVSITNKEGTFTATLKIQTSRKPGETRVVPVDAIDEGQLWEPRIVDGKHAVDINQSHEYYSKVYAPLLDKPSLITGMDSLLWALAEAEMSTINDEVKEQYEDMRNIVSRILKKLVRDLADPDVDDYEVNN